MHYDLVVIGGGVVGCAVLRRFALSGLRCLLVERGPDLLSGASKANSAILHTGFDAPVGSLEQACIAAGRRAYHDLHGRMNLPLLETGALLLAWDAEQAAALPALLEQAHANGVDDADLVDAATAYRTAPALGPGVADALRVPGEALIDPWSAPLAYARQALDHGARIACRTEVVGGDHGPDGWSLATAAGDRIAAGVVVNCAGLRGDLVERIARPSPFEIRPRRGEFLVYDKPAFALAPAILLPVPTPRTKGIVVTPTVFGNLLVGPTAEDQADRELAEVTDAGLQALTRAGERILPALSAMPVTAVYAGLRPASQYKDFVIEAVPDRSWITVGGIRSTGLSAALGIADHVAGLYAARFGDLPAAAPRHWPAMPSLAEAGPRAWQAGGRGEIVCHCERVTRGEVEAALDPPLAAGDLGGLKRRTRAMMGRCQGFYCLARVTELAAGRLADPPPVERLA